MADPDEKSRTRQRIVRAASEQFRRDGLDATGVRALMAQAGLTHGGFYAYFCSKTELACEAIAQALDDTRTELVLVLDRAPPGAKLEAFVAGYLSKAHRRMREKGCAAAALAEEIARQPVEVRQTFDRAIRQTVEVIAQEMPSGGTEQQRLARAYGVFSMLMGALQLSRSADDKAAERLLGDVRKQAIALANLPW